MGLERDWFVMWESDYVNGFVCMARMILKCNKRDDSSTSSVMGGEGGYTEESYEHMGLRT